MEQVQSDQNQKMKRGGQYYCKKLAPFKNETKGFDCK